ncbi:hypothetical protein CN059_26395 [Sinorhizobium medicae]|uniref:hypothetical protein n=1 Tax=Sinorhizobium medicae TaxID=110321 RepID=UPI000C7C4636|nr:hypothetical protein [Sinorhizobium medicae]MDX0408389.1 hypothetical protein [Sinorhizobium medicae]MDX0420284.1 hypothetical protein [Sinorhizobium medicae]MDX0886160.1 hypothetical protein [Sinorhizobium medicae]MDX0976635.1 hypothetical protein [Sinorhizobium medicae]MDX1034835.1 hypothetical protein [Sinorhizobium medicae]
MYYRFVEVEGEEDDLDRVANEWRAKGYELFQAVYKTTYRWVLIFSRNVGVEQPGNSSAS